jgi:ribosomal protein S27AE
MWVQLGLEIALKKLLINYLILKFMESETFNKIQINQSITTSTGNILINIRENSVEIATKLFKELSDMLKIDNNKNVQIIMPNTPKYFPHNILRASNPMILGGREEEKDVEIIEVPIEDEEEESFHNPQNDVKRICKRCRASMVLRNGSNGKFWGCSRFTIGNCKYTEKA